MVRPLRIEYEGVLYHVTARGNERRMIYFRKGDCQKFLKIREYFGGLSYSPLAGFIRQDLKICVKF